MNKKACAIAALGALLAGAGYAESSVGYNVVSAPANSDTWFAVPFNNTIELTCEVSSKDAASITVTNTLSSGAYADAYYVRFIDGAAEGLWTTITANDSDSFTIENIDWLSLVNNGDSFRVYKHHTVNSLFPASLEEHTWVDGGVSFFIYSNQRNVDQAQNKARRYFVSRFLGNWSGGDNPIEPDSYVVMRNESGTDVDVITLGVTPDYNMAVYVPANTAMDVSLGTGYPIPVSVENMPGAANRSILYYDSDTVGINKSRTAFYSYFLGSWSGSAGQDIDPSEGMILRLSSSDAGGKITIPKPY